MAKFSKAFHFPRTSRRTTRWSPYAIGITTAVLALGGLAVASRSRRLQGLKENLMLRWQQTMHPDQGVLVGSSP